MLSKFIEIAFTVGLSSTYGWGELFCGDYNKPQPCSKGAVTASGQVFDPDLPTAAVAAPRNLRMRPVVVGMRVPGGRCVAILVNDKMSERWINKRGFDLSRGALRALGVKDHPQMIRVESCKLKETK